MNVTIKSATIDEKQLIFDLIQPYLDELSHFPDQDPDYKDENGIYHYPYLDAYWREHERYPYLLHSDGIIAGLALVRQDGERWEMAEFYVLPKFRRQGLGMKSAMEILKRHQGAWKILYNKQNQPGQTLWQNLAERSSKGGILTSEEDASHDCVSFLV